MAAALLCETTTTRDQADHTDYPVLTCSTLVDIMDCLGHLHQAVEEHEHTALQETL